MMKFYAFALLLFSIQPFVASATESVVLDPGNQPHVIYGPDDRLDRYQVTDPFLLRLADASCAMVAATNLSFDNQTQLWTINTTPFRISGLEPCPDEPFRNQQGAADCSAFWVGGDLIATAGHCINAGTLSSRRFVFGFAMETEGVATTQVPSSHVYTPIELVSHASSGSRDHALVRLDRPVQIPGVLPLDIRREGGPDLGTPVGVIGHPSRLPQKIAFGDTTRVKVNSNPDFFMANVDTYGGNSGSPTFNATTGMVEGILVRGEPDYDTSTGMAIPHVFDNSQIGNLGGVLPAPLTPGAAEAVIRPVVSLGNPGELNAAFTIDVAVAENNSGLIPASAVLRVYFPAASVGFLGVDGGVLGGVSFQAPVESAEGPPGTDTMIQITAAGNTNNTNPTPLIAKLRFMTTEEAYLPYLIALGNTANPASNLMTKRCFRSNRLSDDHPSPEDITRTVVFAEFVPRISSLTFSNTAFRCAGLVTLHLYSTSEVTNPVRVYTDGGDEEFVIPVPHPIEENLWTVALPLAMGVGNPGNGILDVVDAQTIGAEYSVDGFATLVAATSVVDCAPPQFQILEVIGVGPEWVQVAYGVSEPGFLAVAIKPLGEGESEVVADVQLLDGAREGTLLLTDLQACTTYYVEAIATDVAGNETVAGGPAAPYIFRTFQGALIASQDFEDEEPGGELGGGWTVVRMSEDSPGTVVADLSTTGSTQLFAFQPGLGRVDESFLVSPVLEGAGTLQFHHAYQAETGFDGAVIEASVDDENWEDLEPHILSNNRYDQVISSLWQSPISGRRAWTGGSISNRETVVVNLASYEDPLRVRFRWASDSAIASVGWQIDNIIVTGKQECPATDRCNVVQLLLSLSSTKGIEDRNRDGLVDAADLWE